MQKAIRRAVRHLLNRKPKPFVRGGTRLTLSSEIFIGSDGELMRVLLFPHGLHFQGNHNFTSEVIKFMPGVYLLEYSFPHLTSFHLANIYTSEGVNLVVNQSGSGKKLFRCDRIVYYQCILASNRLIQQTPWEFKLRCIEQWPLI
jgi:hypothetical protein